LSVSRFTLLSLPPQADVPHGRQPGFIFARPCHPSAPPGVRMRWDLQLLRDQDIVDAVVFVDTAVLDQEENSADRVAWKVKRIVSEYC